VSFVADELNLPIVPEGHMVPVSVKEMYLFVFLSCLYETVIRRMICFALNVENPVFEPVFVLCEEFLLFPCDKQNDVGGIAWCYDTARERLISSEVP
jgi:hypothetical protein